MDKIYSIYSYFDKNLRGLCNSYKTNSWDNLVDFSHKELTDGNFVKLINNHNGKNIVINPKEYFEEFDGEFIININDL